MRGDVTIVGSGISGSVLALVLQQMGYHVRLVDRQSHPRFAIGESSTPYADLVLRSLATRYGLPSLNILSRYGLWRKQHPHLRGGSKRGFVYYPPPEEKRATDPLHNGEIVVASSRSRDQGDSNWVRSSLDHHLHQLCFESGIECCNDHDLITAVRRNEMWDLRFRHSNGESSECRTHFLIDATGKGVLANHLFGFSTDKSGFRTNTSAIFTHMDPLPEFRSILTDSGLRTDHYPFPPDESAMHHLTDDGWFWTLRFDDGRTSIGQLTDLNEFPAPPKPDSLDAWIQSSSFPPLLKKQLNRASLCIEPGQLLQSGRLQRRLSRASAPGWIALPSTFGFVDPLHSTGVAWSLHGVEWIARCFEHGFPKSDALEQYEENLSRELSALDLIISAAYHTRRDPLRFELSVMLFFVATVVSEQRRIPGPNRTHGFLATDNDRLWDRIRQSVAELTTAPENSDSVHQRQRWFNQLGTRFQEWNNVGLFDASAHGIYQHTAPEFNE